MDVKVREEATRAALGMAENKLDETRIKGGLALFLDKLSETHAIVPRKLTEEQRDAIHRDWRGLLNEAQVEVLYRAMIEAATNPAP